MNIEVTRDGATGTWRLSYKRHLFVVVGVLLLTGGLAMLAGPWWLPIAEALIGQAGMRVEPDYQWLGGGATTLSGLLLLGYKYFVLDAGSARIQNDRKKLAQLVSDIHGVRGYLSTLVDDHSYRSSQNRLFRDTAARHATPEHALQDPTTASLYSDFAVAGQKLESFVMGNFFIFPSGSLAVDDTRYCLWPHFNIDREMSTYDPVKTAEYREYARELDGLVKDAREKFDTLLVRLNIIGYIDD